ncbi:MAG: hypothetical protein VKK99_05620 [Cyanobacteriota bacterium]|nr:hypothetical protein [Cyanobacteriota bacterium]
MPRSLRFHYGESETAFAMVKVDRGKLYGSRSIETLDADGQRCNLATLASDGRTLIPNGGTAIAHLSPSGLWVENDTLAAVDREGHPLAKHPSSFEGPIVLEETVDEDLLLEHSIRLTYALAGEGAATGALMGALAEGSIFTFPFSWRGGFDTDPAFLLQSEEGGIWLLIGDPNTIRLVGLEQAAACGPEAEEEPEAEGETGSELDFTML